MVNSRVSTLRAFELGLETNRIVISWEGEEEESGADGLRKDGRMTWRPDSLGVD